MPSSSFEPSDPFSSADAVRESEHSDPRASTTQRQAPSTSGTIWRWGLIAGGIVGLLYGLFGAGTLLLPAFVRVPPTAFYYPPFFVAAALAGVLAGWRSRHWGSGSIAGVTVAVVGTSVAVVILVLISVAFDGQVSPRAVESILTYGMLLVLLGTILGTAGGLVGWFVTTRADAADSA